MDPARRSSPWRAGSVQGPPESFKALRSCSRHVGRFDPRTEQWEIVALSGTGYRPYGIVVDRNDRPWFVMMGANRLGTVDPNTLQVREIELPREATRSRRLDLTSDGRVWYAD